MIISDTTKLLLLDIDIEDLADKLDLGFVDACRWMANMYHISLDGFQTACV